jgi:hypothetical protein
LNTINRQVVVACFIVDLFQSCEKFFSPIIQSSFKIRFKF